MTGTTPPSGSSAATARNVAALLARAWRVRTTSSHLVPTDGPLLLASQAQRLPRPASSSRPRRARSTCSPGLRRTSPPFGAALRAAAQIPYDVDVAGPRCSAHCSRRAGRRGRRGASSPRVPSAPVTCGTSTTTSPISPPGRVREWCRSRSSVHAPRVAARTRCRGCAPGSTSCSASRSTSASTATRRAEPFSPDRGSGCARSSPIMSVPRAPAPVRACPVLYLSPRTPGAPRDQ